MFPFLACVRTTMALIKYWGIGFSTDLRVWARLSRIAFCEIAP